LPACQTVAIVRIAPKIVRGSPQQCTQSALDFIQIGSLSAEIAECMNIAKLPRRVNRIFDGSLAASRTMIASMPLDYLFTAMLVTWQASFT